MTQYSRGRKKEWLVRDTLKALGYTVGRMAGSHGLYDIHAVNNLRHRLIQVKYTKKKRTSKARPWWDKNCKKFYELQVPPHTTKEVWVYYYGDSTPHVIYLATPKRKVRKVFDAVRYPFVELLLTELWRNTENDRWS